MSQNKMSLFNIVKITTSFINELSTNIILDYKTAQRNGIIVSVGDNQLLRFIRQVNDVEFNKDKYLELVATRNMLKKGEKKNNHQELLETQNAIDEMMFVPDLITIKTDTTKQDYKNICKSGLTITMTVNGKVKTTTYKRLCAGAGQLRRNSAFFVNVNIYDELENIMMCGLTKKKIGKINLAKFSAYYALYTSATKKVTTPNICVVKDFKYMLKDQTVKWVYDKEDDEKEVETRLIDFEINAFDGSGMITPHFARIWQDDLEKDYLPASFIIRSALIKGLVSIFEFKEFANNVAHTDHIIDAWGNKKYVKDIDMILTTSQFKMWDKYESWEEYIYYHQKYKHVFGVARSSKEENDYMTTLNYQYIQSNNFTEETIKGLADFSVEWMKDILKGDELAVRMFLIGKQDEEDSLEEIEDKIQTPLARALLYSGEILKDEYARKKIVKMAEKKIDQLKVGKLYVEGSYDFAIPDLYAMAEHAFGMEVRGLLGIKQSWNKRWVDKETETVSMMRSPLVSPSENQLINIYNDEKCYDWFKYIYSGMILNIWDMALIRASDADKYSSPLKKW